MLEEDRKEEVGVVVGTDGPPPPPSIGKKGRKVGTKGERKFNM
jgi:hypothetical protein